MKLYNSLLQTKEILYGITRQIKNAVLFNSLFISQVPAVEESVPEEDSPPPENIPWYYGGSAQNLASLESKLIAAWSPIEETILNDSFTNIAGSETLTFSLTGDLELNNGWVATGNVTLDTPDNSITTIPKTIVLGGTEFSQVSILGNTLSTYVDLGEGGPFGVVYSAVGTNSQAEPPLTSGVITATWGDTAHEKGYRNGIAEVGVDFTIREPVGNDWLQIVMQPTSSTSVFGVAIYNAVLTDAEILAISQRLNLLIGE